MRIFKFLCIVQLAIVLYVTTHALPMMGGGKYGDQKDNYEPKAEEGFCSRSDAGDKQKTDANTIVCGPYQPSWSLSQIVGLKAARALSVPKDLTSLLKRWQPFLQRLPGMPSY